ncbi:GntR family transcriptional regulator [Xylophilus sp. Leaf220]|uniref:GntR family transcriptional regulator n=1 Tax=Xylophilus sp. Leaf220 TaxID=1735686 RepID=UPI0006FC886E|nr:GntR family transcriptional regulator [Xylophilus sp. Leaf220]KQM70224.1 GntR family transcriptional regulator [Xylophilus sp. Leaf220]
MTVELVPVPAAALHQQVAQRLRQMLIEGAIAPGSKLNERELCAALAVSRTPLREAIKMLAIEGLVVLLPNRGAVAVQLTEDDVRHTFEVMAGLEAQSGELAARRVTDEEIAEIRALHYEMLAAWTRRDLPGYYRLNAQIHQAINAAAKNPVLVATYVQINARLHALRFRSNQDETKWARAVADHERMVEALAARDPQAMREVLSQHLAAKLETVLAQLRADGSVPARDAAAG